jgi:hypothetical protein
MRKTNPWYLTRVFDVFVAGIDLFGGAAASFDAGAGGCEEGAGRAYDSEDGGGVFWGVRAASLCMQREGHGKQENEAEKHEGGSLH